MQLGRGAVKNGRVIDDFMTTTTPEKCFNKETVPGAPVWQSAKSKLLCPRLL
jgi:hypothetical protein